MRFSIQIHTTWAYRTGEPARKPHGDPAGASAIGAATDGVEDVVEEGAVIGRAVEDVVDSKGNCDVAVVAGADTAPDATDGP